MSVCLMCGGGNASLLFRQTDRLYRTTRKEFSVVRCEQCGLARLDPQKNGIAGQCCGDTCDSWSSRCEIPRRAVRCSMWDAEAGCF
jgi:hypothetical protein